MAIEMTQEQKEVVCNRGGNLLVSAAAGSGKTRVLVERLMNYIRSGFDIDQFLVITFTNAAAAELRDRIAQSINELLVQHPENRHLRRNVTLVYKAQISTIDAFCLNFLRECGPAAGLDPDFRICDEAEGKALGQTAMETVLERRYQGIESDGNFQTLVEALADDRDDQTLEDVIYEVHGKIQSHPDPLKWLQERKKDYEVDPSCSLEQTSWGSILLEDGREQTDYWAEEINRLLDLIQEDPVLDQNYRESLEATLHHLQGLSDAMRRGWDEAVKMGPVPFPTPKKKKGADPVLKGQVKQVRDLCKKQMNQVKERFSIFSGQAMEELRADAPAMIALLDVVAEYDQELTALKNRRRLLNFADAEHLTARLLQEPDGRQSALAAEWSKRYVEIMVDEYQDTNAVQNAIFQALSAGDNLFMVGDVKQSIYRFRLADPTIFLEKYENYADGSVAEEGEGRTLRLSRNFRSRPEILEAVNFIFRNVMSKRVGEMDYTDEEALIPGREDFLPDSRYRVELDCVDLSNLSEDPDEEKPKKDLIEARAVVRRIAELLREGLPAGDHPVTPDDIVILLRSPGPVISCYIQALDEAGLPWRAEGGREFYETTEISTALAFLQIIDNPRQDVPLLAVLRSPLYDVSPDWLAELRAEGQGSIYDCLKAGEERGDPECRKFLDELAELRSLSAEESSYRLIWYLYEQTGLLSVFSSMPEGEYRRANLLALFDAAREFENSEHKGLFDFLNHIGRMRDSNSPVPVETKSGSGIRILSIHKSKGLEFPVVFLCGLDHQFNESDSRATILFHNQYGLGPKHTDRQRMVRYTTAARDAVSLQLRREMRSEELRLLYVAMTRAEHKLFLFTAVNGARGTTLSSLAVQAECPPSPWQMSQARAMDAWVLTPALCRRESTPLWADLEQERPSPPEDPGPEWEIRLLPGEEYEQPLPAEEKPAEETEPERLEMTAEELTERFQWQYPHQSSVNMPSKLTATQLKGREKDGEISEEAAELLPQRSSAGLRRPIFEKERPLTATEKGTALHLVMQYLNYEKTNTDGEIREEISRLIAEQFVTPAQGNSVNPRVIRLFFRSNVGKRLKMAVRVEREFKFSMLVPAEDYYPEGEPGESLLLQGVVDCWFQEADGTVTVVDFKTDRVTENTVEERAKGYRPQLDAYSRALSEVLELPVSQKCLWFFAVNQQISW